MPSDRHRSSEHHRSSERSSDQRSSHRRSPDRNDARKSSRRSPDRRKSDRRSPDHRSSDRRSSEHAQPSNDQNGRSGNSSGVAVTQEDIAQRSDVCRAYLKNLCDRGDRCKFYHPPGMQGIEKPPERPRSPSTRNVPTFSLDEFEGIPYLRAGCDRGDHCKYVHATRAQYDEYKRSGHIDPEMFRSIAIVTGKMRPEGMPVCMEFTRGQCHRGEACRYSHSQPVRDPTFDRPAISPDSGERGLVPTRQYQVYDEFSTYKLEFCVSYRSAGGCDRGDHCRYVHGTRAQYEDYKRNGRISPSLDRCVALVTGKLRPEGPPVCMEYQRGICSRGAACKYQHRLPERDPTFDLAALEGTPEALAIEWTGSSGGAKRPRYDEIVQNRIAAITAAGEPGSATGADGSSTAVVPATKATTEPELTRRIGELETLLSELRRENDALRTISSERKKDYDTLFGEFCKTQVQLVTLNRNLKEPEQKGS